jgi:hypothetical protein
VRRGFRESYEDPEAQEPAQRRRLRLRAVGMARRRGEAGIRRESRTPRRRTPRSRPGGGSVPSGVKGGAFKRRPGLSSARSP